MNQSLSWPEAEDTLSDGTTCAWQLLSPDVQKLFNHTNTTNELRINNNITISNNDDNDDNQNNKFVSSCHRNLLFSPLDDENDLFTLIYHNTSINNKLSKIPNDKLLIESLPSIQLDQLFQPIFFAPPSCYNPIQTNEDKLENISRAIIGEQSDSLFSPPVDPILFNQPCKSSSSTITIPPISNTPSSLPSERNIFSLDQAYTSVFISSSPSVSNIHDEGLLVLQQCSFEQWKALFQNSCETQEIDFSCMTAQNYLALVETVSTSALCDAVLRIAVPKLLSQCIAGIQKLPDDLTLLLRACISRSTVSNMDAHTFRIHLKTYSFQEFGTAGQLAEMELFASFIQLHTKPM